MATETKDPKSSNNDLLENPEAIVEQISKSEEFVKSNFKIIAGILVLIAAGIGGFIYMNNQSAENEKLAQLDLYKAQYYFNIDSLNLALKGDTAGSMGLLDISSDHDGTKAGNLANYLAGACYLKKGEFDKSIEYLSKFESGDMLVQGRAYAMLGDAYSEKGDQENAISNYKKASEYKANEYLTPNYLMKLALAYELSGQFASAIESYEKLEDNFPNAQEIADAKKYLARARAMQTQDKAQ